MVRLPDGHFIRISNGGVLPILYWDDDRREDATHFILRRVVVYRGKDPHSRWQWCWWLYDGYWFQMLVAESLCWWFSQCIKSVTNILNRSTTSQTCHQHIWASKFVTKIDVTAFSSLQRWFNKSPSKNLFQIDFFLDNFYNASFRIRH